jgi:hypothetical protein
MNVTRVIPMFLFLPSTQRLPRREGTAGVVDVGVYARAPLTELDIVEPGSHEVEKVVAVVPFWGK